MEMGLVVSTPFLMVFSRFILRGYKNLFFNFSEFKRSATLIFEVLASIFALDCKY